MRRRRPTDEELEYRPTDVELGKAAFARGEFALAAECFEEVVRSTTTPSTTHSTEEGLSGEGGGKGAQHVGKAATYSNLSASYLELGKSREALQAADKCIAEDAAWPKGHYRRGLALLRMKELPRARVSFTRALELDPNSAELAARLSEVGRLERHGGAARHGMAKRSAVLPKPSWASEDRGSTQAAHVEDLPSIGTPKLSAENTNARPDITRAQAKMRDRLAPKAPAAAPTPLLVSEGAAAFDTLRIRKKASTTESGVIEAIKARPTLDSGRRAGGRAKTKSDDAVDDTSEAFTHKRCVMCGNVCDRRMAACSSCCLPLVHPTSFEPAALPRPGARPTSGANADSDSDSDSDNDNDSVGDDEGARAPPPPAAGTERDPGAHRDTGTGTAVKAAYAKAGAEDACNGGGAAKAGTAAEMPGSAVGPALVPRGDLGSAAARGGSALSRVRLSRKGVAVRVTAPDARTAVAEGTTASGGIDAQGARAAAAAAGLPWWVEWLGRDGLAAPTHPPGRDPALRRHYATLGVPVGSGRASVRAAYLVRAAAVHPDAGGSPEELLQLQVAHDTIDRDQWRHEEVRRRGGNTFMRDNV